MTVSGIHHLSVQASDFEASLAFYTQLLGLRVRVPPFDYKTRRLCYLDAGNAQIELYSTKSGEAPCVAYTPRRCGLDHIAFVTSDLRGLLEQLAQRGVRVIKPAFTLETAAGVSMLAFVEGPDGQEIELRQRDSS